MLAKNGERPATDGTVNGARESDRLAGAIDQIHKPQLQNAQVRHLVSSYPLTEQRARIVARLHFGEAQP